MSDPQLVLNRTQLAEFLKDPRAIRAFEQMFTLVSSTIPDSIEATQHSGDSLQGQIAEVIGSITALAAAILTQPPKSLEYSVDYTNNHVDATQEDLYVPPIVIESSSHNPNALATSAVNLTNFASSNLATMTNAPINGDPLKWVAVNDNGVIRRIPTW